MACPKCPNCETQMEEESVYGAGRLCRCPSCNYRTKHPEGPLKPPIGPKAVKEAFDTKVKEK